MTFEEAVRKSIKAYFNGEDPTALIDATEGGAKYTREYFDELEADLLGKKAAEETDEDMETEGEEE